MYIYQQKYNYNKFYNHDILKLVHCLVRQKNRID